MGANGAVVLSGLWLVQPGGVRCARPVSRRPLGLTGDTSAVAPWLQISARADGRLHAQSTLRSTDSTEWTARRPDMLVRARPCSPCLAGVLLRPVEERRCGGLFYRSLAFVATMALFVAWRHRGGTHLPFSRSAAPSGARGTRRTGSAHLLFIFAMLQTTVAAVVVHGQPATSFAALFASDGDANEAVTRREAGEAMAGSIVGRPSCGPTCSATTIAGNLLALACCLRRSAGIVRGAGPGGGHGAGGVPGRGVRHHRIGRGRRPGGDGARSRVDDVPGARQAARHQYMLITAASRAVPAAT